MRPKSLPFAIALFLFSIYLLTFSGKFHVMDELAVFTAGHNLAQHRRADINQLIWTNHWTPNPPGIWGRDGNLYTKKPPGISFITAPLIWLGHRLPDLNAVHAGLLTNAIVTALTASFLFIWLINLGFTQPAATLTALGYGLGTIAWVYARMFWESSLLAFFFLLAVWAAYRATHLAQPQRRWWWLLLCGLALAISLTLRFEAVLALVLIGLYLAASRPRSEEATRGGEAYQRPSRLMLYLVPSFLVGLSLLYFNFIRYGSFSETGYSQEILFREPWVGAYGLLFSPGRGLFIYSPLLLLLFLGVRPAWQRLPRFYFWLIVALCLGYWLFYGAWFAWGGAWGWGPRFLLPILPLLMVFVAETIEEVGRWGGEEARRRESRGAGKQGSREAGEQENENAHASRISAKPPLGTHHALRITLYVLLLLSLTVNLLGILVDFNEHFLRLGSNQNFVFNWAVFPPLAHWQILQEGLVDLIWLGPGPEGLQIEWPVLLPALILFALATANLIITYQGQKEIRNKKLEISMPDAPRPMLHASSFILRPSSFILVLLTLILTYLMLRGAAQVALANAQAQFDLPVLATLNASARPGDALLVSMPPFGDVQEISTRLMAYVGRSLPIYAWIESDPRAIQPVERERVWQAVQADSQRIWLFERWLTQDDPVTATATRLNQEAFPLQEQWFEQSGRLTLYALAGQALPAPTPLNMPFQGGLTLVDFAVLGDSPAPGEELKLRLTWQAAIAADVAAQNAPAGSIIAFAQILNETSGQKVAQNDRLLVDLQNFNSSPLLPGQTIQQGYGLQLPEELPPGKYSLIIGLYQASSGQRLPRADGSPDDFLYLTTVPVADSR
ncbi:MAG TPA: hypothetical protein VEC93_19565 [Anaerolineae bacterium]|nr:hypothetical protein [Anaerolineae bacterium]